MRFFVCLFTLIAGPAAADVFIFETPSGNIVCSVGLEENYADIACGIVEKSGAPPQPRPADCSKSWGHSFFLRERGPVEMQCVERPTRLRDENIAYIDQAPYGETGTFGEITCRSERTGFERRNADGRGIFLSRRAQRVF